MISLTEKDSEACRGMPGKKKSKLKYKGVRNRSGRNWVSQIREPNKQKRIWLGSYDSPKMAARAYDTAALLFKGDYALLNFPESSHRLPRPSSSDLPDIQAAASRAVHEFDPRRMISFCSPPWSAHSQSSASRGSSSKPPEPQLDETYRQGWSEVINIGNEAFQKICCNVTPSEGNPVVDFMGELPNMVMNMAEAPLLTPPHSLIEETVGYYEETESGEALYSLWTH